MSGFKDREEKRKKSIVGSMVNTDLTNNEKHTKKKDKEKPERVQRAYFYDKDLFKALQIKAIEEETNLTEAVNDALRKGLKEYLK